MHTKKSSLPEWDWLKQIYLVIYHENKGWEIKMTNTDLGKYKKSEENNLLVGIFRPSREEFWQAEDNEL